MSEIKSHEFEAFRQKSIRFYRIFLVYGPDRGLVSERAQDIAQATGVKLDDPFALVRMDGADIQADPGRLLDEVNAIGLFGGEKLIWIRSSGSEKALGDGLQILSEKPPEGAFVVIEAGDLKKTALLRKIAEPSRAIAAIPCYPDDARSLNALIDAELSAAQLRITPAARQLLLESLGGDRIASRNEIKKLVIYCMGLPVIDEDNVVEIIGDASAISTDDAVDAVLSGDPDALLHATQKIIASKTSIFLVLQNCLRQFQLLDLMRAEMDDKRLQPAQVMQTMARHVHFRRKPLIETALRNWPSDALSREANRLQTTILMTRQRASLEDSVALQTLLSTTLQSQRRNRR